MRILHLSSSALAKFSSLRSAGLLPRMERLDPNGRVHIPSVKRAEAPRKKEPRKKREPSLTWLRATCCEEVPRRSMRERAQYAAYARFFLHLLGTRRGDFSFQFSSDCFRVVARAKRKDRCRRRRRKSVYCRNFKTLPRNSEILYTKIR